MPILQLTPGISIPPVSMGPTGLGWAPSCRKVDWGTGGVPQSRPVMEDTKSPTPQSVGYIVCRI